MGPASIEYGAGLATSGPVIAGVAIAVGAAGAASAGGGGGAGGATGVCAQVGVAVNPSWHTANVAMLRRNERDRLLVMSGFPLNEAVGGTPSPTGRLGANWAKAYNG